MKRALKEEARLAMDPETQLHDKIILGKKVAEAAEAGRNVRF